MELSYGILNTLFDIFYTIALKLRLKIINKNDDEVSKELSNENQVSGARSKVGLR